ncbi:uncharacterized protein TNCV_1259771 [Trichonephila clavipes]|nr:uncharacterized protein TNCV_1259771 [Trichonephila clavipes]
MWKLGDGVPAQVSSFSLDQGSKAHSRRIGTKRNRSQCSKRLFENSNAKLLGAVDTRRYPRAENRIWSDQEEHEERGLKDRAASTCGPHGDSFNDTSRRPFLNGLPGAIFQQDNARPHTARVAQDFLRHFQTLTWPVRSPD